jgi:hypothetical protein
MRTALATILILTAMALPLASDRNCDGAYVRFMDHLGQTPPAQNGDRLAQWHRRALRIFYACDGGHLQHPEVMFRDLEKQIADL